MTRWEARKEQCLKDSLLGRMLGMEELDAPSTGRE